MRATTRYFALFGPAASGKTVYLGALYGSGGDASDGAATGAFHVAASERADDPTHAYLGSIARALRAGRWPDSTAFERLEKTTFRFTCGDLCREVVLPDVGGELTRRAVDTVDRERMAVGLKAQILAEYEDYHGFLLVVPADAADPARASEYKWEVDAFLDALRRRSPDGAMIARPLAVLITKWDLVEPGPLDAGSEARAAANLEATHPELASSLKILCRNVRVFPVSATGPLEFGLPPMPLQPVNLGAPIAWLAEASERVMLERVIAYINRAGGEIFRRDPDDEKRRTHMQVARGRLADFLEDVPVGSLADEARVRVAELGRLRRRRVGRRLAFGALALVLLAVAVIGHRDLGAYHRALSLLEVPQAGTSTHDVINRVGVVASRSCLNHPVGHALFLWARLQGRLRDYRAKWEPVCFNSLKPLTEPANEGDARDQEVRINQYLEDFPDSPNRVLVEAQQARVVAYLRIKDQERAYEALQVELGKASNDPWQCYGKCGEFLERDPSHPRADFVRRDREGYLVQADDAEWHGVEAHVRNYPELFSSQIEKVDAYLANKAFTAHRDDAARFRSDAYRGYDRSNYNAIRNKLREGTSPRTLESLRKLCNDYVSATIPNKSMMDEVGKLVRWFDGWDRGSELYIRVAAIRIDRNSAWHTWSWFVDPWVHITVTIGGRAFSTGQKSIPLGRDIGEIPQDRLGPFLWKWGDPEVVVTLHHKGGSPEDYSENYDDGDAFKIRHLNRITSFDGGKISVRLECPEVVPPTLLPYPAN
jgi:hypothetical protein